MVLPTLAIAAAVAKGNPMGLLCFNAWSSHDDEAEAIAGAMAAN